MEKAHEHFLFTAHQEIVIQYVENNLTIIYCKNGDFSFNLKFGVVNSISEKKKPENFFHDASEFSHSFCRE